MAALSVVEHIGSILLICDILLKWIYDFRGYWRTILNVIDAIIIPLTSPILTGIVKMIHPPIPRGNNTVIFYLSLTQGILICRISSTVRPVAKFWVKIEMRTRLLSCLSHIVS